LAAPRRELYSQLPRFNKNILSRLFSRRRLVFERIVYENLLNWNIFKQLLLAELRRHAQNVSDDQAAALDAAGDDAKESADFALRDGIEEDGAKTWRSGITNGE